MINFKGFFYLVLEEKGLKQLCLKKATFLSHFFIAAIPYFVSMYFEREKKVKKKKVSYLPTLIFVRP